MATNAANPSDEFPTDEPAETVYEQYRFVTSAEDGGIIYHVDDPKQWVEGETLALEEWR
jgi:hypothetical protein